MKRYLLTAAAAALILALLCTAVYGAGDVSDPLISLSYLEGRYTETVLSRSDSLFSKTLSSAYRSALYTANQELGAARRDAAAADDSLHSLTGTLRVKSGDRLFLETGSSVRLIGGEPALESGGLVDATGGVALEAGSVLTPNSLCFSTSRSGCWLRVISDTAQLYIDGVYSLDSSDSPDYNSLADALSALGLFRGDSTGYALERSATRTEGLVMFIRLMGEEEEALASEGAHPFTDVAGWADRYVAYAWEKGYTNGISETLFGSSNELTSQHYITFLLRALGFSEGTDFSWESAGEDAQALGLINSAELSRLNSDVFHRGEVAYLSYYSLFATGADGIPLMEKLILSGTIERGRLGEGLSKIVGVRQ